MTDLSRFPDSGRYTVTAEEEALTSALGHSGVKIMASGQRSADLRALYDYALCCPHAQPVWPHVLRRFPEYDIISK